MKVLVLSINSNPNQLLTEKKLGLLSGNIDNMKNELVTILASKRKFEQITKRALDYSKNHFSIDKIGETHLNEFKKLVSRN